MSNPSDEEVGSHLRKSNNERFVEAIESVDRRVAALEQIAAQTMRDSAITAAATTRTSQRSIFWPVLGAMIVFVCIPVIVTVLLWAIGIGALILGAGAKSVTDQIRPVPPKPAPAPAIVVPRPARTTPGLTLANFNAIKTGEDYTAVQTRLGAHGQEASRTETSSGRTVVMRWDLDRPAGAYIVVTFRDGLVIAKQQVGLE